MLWHRVVCIEYYLPACVGRYAYGLRCSCIILIALGRIEKEDLNSLSDSVVASRRLKCPLADFDNEDLV